MYSLFILGLVTVKEGAGLIWKISFDVEPQVTR